MSDSSTANIPKVTYQYETESQSKKLWTKIQKEPFVPLGIIGMVSALAFGFYKYKHRGNMSTSVYLMHLRVQAQSMVVGAMSIGVTYSLLKDYWYKKNGNGDDHSK